MNLVRTKSVVRSVLAAPGVRHGLRWFINDPRIPTSWRDTAHRRIAKRARFGRDQTFEYVTGAGTTLHFVHSGTSNYLYWKGAYEAETTSLFCRLAQQSKVVVDIGAADGIYTILAAAANPAARIVAFEPADVAARLCARNIELNRPVTANVELCSVALGDTDRETTFYVAGETGGNSSAAPGFRGDVREQRVTMRRAESVLAERGIDRIDLVKIDTESTEPSVLRGLGRYLRDSKPAIVCEVLHGRTEAQLEAVLGPLGYRYYWIGEHGPEPRDHIVGDSTYRYPNYLFTVGAPP